MNCCVAWEIYFLGQSLAFRCLNYICLSHINAGGSSQVAPETLLSSPLSLFDVFLLLSLLSLPAPQLYPLQAIVGQVCRGSRGGGKGEYEGGKSKPSSPSTPAHYNTLQRLLGGGGPSFLAREVLCVLALSCHCVTSLPRKTVPSSA